MYGGGGGESGHSLREILLYVVIESRTIPSNSLITDKRRSFILLDTVFTEIQPHRECDWPSDTSMTLFFVESNCPRPTLTKVDIILVGARRKVTSSAIPRTQDNDS